MWVRNLENLHAAPSDAACMHMLWPTGKLCLEHGCKQTVILLLEQTTDETSQQDTSDMSKLGPNDFRIL